MPEAHRAKRGRQSRLSPIWIVPLVAVVIGLWLVYDNYSRRGPEVILEMPNAEGIEAGKTLIKTRNVQVGRVESVKLSEDLTHTLVTARMSQDVDRMLNEESRFWVVKPRIGREGISGLNTVLSGAYIQLQPGDSEESQYRFKVLEHPPVAPPGAEGIRINLISEIGSSLRVGDPVTYQGLTVGRVEDAEFDPEERQMDHRLFIESPYDDLITESTRFWTASGIDLGLDSEGFRVNIESIETLIGGGVTFAVPKDLPMGAKASAGDTYELFPNEESAVQGTFTRNLEYVLLVDDTVRGLAKGSPVEYRGVRVGTVTNVPWHFSAPQPETRQRFAIPVLIRIEPQRLIDKEEEIDLDEWRARFDRMFGFGMRATLKAGNLLTGALFVDLNFQEEVADYQPETFDGKPVFPTTSGGFAQIEQKVSNLLDKLNALEIEPILGKLDRNLATTEKTFEEVRAATESFRSLLEDPKTREIPANLNASLRELRQTMKGLSPDSPVYKELTKTLQSMEKLVRDLQPVAETLRDQPNALIFDRSGGPDPIPRAPDR
ncbi:paraquat-inducible protein B [Modicisalibacter ilicicola DSM 19980]|uniref:Paraquat-inducible protein B n=1 Tax=Modicisalibacter ilicicola DSM 19980 TaxID=1121942 RepID=A0A1M5CK29_9GAMM|nr:intermembrane transport protein PqiB [Halomonas ilicicola]SHF55125.1 paraquat-inducible protein B [Halomonas ilicicola DSM 19980]